MRMRGCLQSAFAREPPVLETGYEATLTTLGCTTDVLRMVSLCMSTALPLPFTL